MKISNSIRDLLIDHLDGRRVPFEAAGVRPVTMSACLKRGLVRFDQPGVRKTTVITKIGRAALAEALAEWADALIRAGVDLENPSPAIPSRLAELRKWASDWRFRAAQDYSHI